MLQAGRETNEKIHFLMGGYIEPTDPEYENYEDTQWYDANGNWVGNCPPGFSDDSRTLNKLFAFIPKIIPTGYLDWEEQADGSFKWCVLTPADEEKDDIYHYDTPNLALCAAILEKGAC